MRTSIRQGTVADHSWIAELLRDGAAEGHFGETLSAQADAMLDSIARFGGLRMMKARRGQLEPCTMQVDVLVADCAGTPAAFLLCLNDAEGYELHLSGTQPRFRRRGCFTALVNHAIANTPMEARIFARCYRRSDVALAALQQHGFVISSAGEPIELTLPAERPVVVCEAAPDIAGNAKPEPSEQLGLFTSWLRRVVTKYRA